VGRGGGGGGREREDAAAQGAPGHETAARACWGIGGRRRARCRRTEEAFQRARGTHGRTGPLGRGSWMDGFAASRFAPVKISGKSSVSHRAGMTNWQWWPLGTGVVNTLQHVTYVLPIHWVSAV